MQHDTTTLSPAWVTHFAPRTDAGISLTVAINVGLSFLLLIVVLSCRGISLYNVNRKKKLMAQAESDIEPTDDTFDHLTPSNQLTSNKKLRFAQVHFLFVWETIKSIFSPAHFRNDAETCTRSYGRDISTYFAFQKLMIYTFSALLILSCSILIPIHLTGAQKGMYITTNASKQSAADAIQQDYNLMLTSMNMVLQSPSFTIPHIVLAAVFIFVISSILVYCFTRLQVVNEFNFVGCDEDVRIENREIIKAGRNQLRTFDRKYQMVLNSSTTLGNHNALLVSPYCVVVHGFPRALNHKFLFEEMIRPLVQDPSLLVKVSLVLDYSQRVKLEKKLEKIESRLEHFNYVMEQRTENDQDENSLLSKPLRPRVMINKLWTDGNYYPVSLDAIEYYVTKRERTIGMIERWDEKLNAHLAIDHDLNVNTAQTDSNSTIMGSGYGFLIFATVEAAKDFCQQYQKHGLKLPISINKRGGATTVEEQSSEANETNLTIKQRLRYFIEKIAIRVERANYEPQDIHWPNVFDRQNMGRLRSIIRERIILGFLVFIAVLFSAPLSLANSLQQLLTLESFGSKALFNMGPRLTAFVFRFLPSFLLAIFTLIIPKFIIKLTKYSRMTTYGEMLRSILTRIYVYLIISNLIIPSLVITSAQSLFEFLQTPAKVWDIISPSSGAFFINLLMQRALLQNMFDAMCLTTFITYLWRTRILLYKHKELTPREKLECAELYDLRIEREYGFMLSVMGISLAYGLISPLIFGAALLYFIIKHIVDKYVVAYTYGHKRAMVDEEGRPLCGAHFGTKSDYVSHKKMVHKICSIVLFNVVLMVVYLFLIFTSKARGDGRFTPHMYTTLALLAVSVFVWLFHSYYYRKRDLNLDRLAEKSKLTPKDVKCDVTYEVPYPYIQRVTDTINIKPSLS